MRSLYRRRSPISAGSPPTGGSSHSSSRMKPLLVLQRESAYAIFLLDEIATHRENVIEESLPRAQEGAEDRHRPHGLVGVDHFFAFRSTARSPTAFQ